MSTLREGLWLGTENRIRSLWWTKTYGWKAVDSTGCSYFQRRNQREPGREFPEGLHASDDRYAGLRPLLPWPAAPVES